MSGELGMGMVMSIGKYYHKWRESRTDSSTHSVRSFGRNDRILSSRAGRTPFVIPSEAEGRVEGSIASSLRGRKAVEAISTR